MESHMRSFASSFTFCLSLAACAGSSDDADDTDVGTDDTDVAAAVDTDTPKDTDVAEDTDVADDTDPCAGTFTVATPIVWYGLADAGSSTIDDAMNYSDAASNGSVGAITGKVGQGASFDGATSYLTASPAFSTGAFSWAAWVRIAALPSSDLAVLANHRNGVISYTGWIVVLTSGGVPRLITEAATGENQLFLDAPSAVTLDTWTHVAVTFDAGALELFVDGVSVAGMSAPYTELVEGTTDYEIGRDANEGTRYLAGDLDEVGYWDVALDEEDVAALFAAGECGVSAF